MVVTVGKVAPTGESPRDLLRTFFQRESESLKPSLRRYVSAAGLAHTQPIDDVVADLLQEVVVQSMEIADKFDVSRNPAPWVLKIAINLIKRRRVEQAKQRRRFVTASLSSVTDQDGDEISPDSIFERIVEASESPEEFLAGRQQAAIWLDLLSPIDRRVVTKAVLCDMDGDELAAELQIKPGTARVQLHRALKRLGNALSVQSEEITP